MNKPYDDGLGITPATVPMPIWTRTWTDQQGQFRQALYAVWVPGAPLVGVRVSIHLDNGSVHTPSYASAEVFDGVQWHAVAGLPPALMRTRQVSGQRRYWDDDGEQADTARLLEDVRVAFEYRSSANIPRTSHEPPPEAESKPPLIGSMHQ